MNGGSDSRTSLTLLARLKDRADAAAWTEFVRRYSPRIYRWCTHWGLQPADAEDVTQEVLVKLARAIDRYRPGEGSFRAWLKVITVHGLADHHKARGRAVAGSGESAVQRLLENEAAREALAQDLETEEYLEFIETRARPHFEPRVWECWRLVVREGKPPAEVAAALGINPANVRQYKHRVQKRIEAEFAALRPAAGGEAG
jgi:RNA polymerase sigma-70 factor (ECF subfamily)